MNVGQFKDLIKDIPEEYEMQVDVMVHPNDIGDLSAEFLAIKKAEKDESKKFLLLSVGMRTLTDVKTSSPPTC